MRPALLVVALLLALPLVAAHEDGVIYRLRADEAGIAAGSIRFFLADDHTFLGIGAAGCTLGSVGALRITTPAQGTLEVTFGATSCTSAVKSVAGDASRLPAGNYVGAYAFELQAPLLIEVYAQG